MFEKESQDYADRETAPRQQLYIKGRADINADYEDVKRIWQDGANFGYVKGKEEAKIIIQDLLDNSDEYARQRAID